MIKNNIISCKRCLMECSDYSVKINADGFCNYCTEFLKTDMQTYKMGHSIKNTLNSQSNNKQQI